MSRNARLLAAIAITAVALPALAIWHFSAEGQWPKTWPAELEQLRKQSRSLNGGIANLTFHEIPFTKREDFEAAWPSLLEVRHKDKPITLFRSPHEFLGKMKAGVRIWDPPYETRNIWLVVDGNIVDLNRIPLPADTKIIDRRFEDSKR